MTAAERSTSEDKRLKWFRHDISHGSILDLENEAALPNCYARDEEDMREGLREEMFQLGCPGSIGQELPVAEPAFAQCTTGTESVSTASPTDEQDIAPVPATIAEHDGASPRRRYCNTVRMERRMARRLALMVRKARSHWAIHTRYGGRPGRPRSILTSSYSTEYSVIYVNRGLPHLALAGVGCDQRGSSIGPVLCVCTRLASFAFR